MAEDQNVETHRAAQVVEIFEKSRVFPSEPEVLRSAIREDDV